MKLRESINSYLHGQIVKAPSSKKSTPATSRAGSSRATSVMSLDRLKRRTKTPPATPPPKRLRGRSRGQPSPLGQDYGDRRSMSYQPEGLPGFFYIGNKVPRAQYLNTNEPLFHPQQAAAIQPRNNGEVIYKQEVYAGSYAEMNQFGAFSQGNMSGHQGHIASMAPLQVETTNRYAN
jgi:hypothetical protein